MARHAPRTVAIWPEASSSRTVLLDNRGQLFHGARRQQDLHRLRGSAGICQPRRGGDAETLRLHLGHRERLDARNP